MSCNGDIGFAVVSVDAIHKIEKGDCADPDDTHESLMKMIVRDASGSFTLYTLTRSEARAVMQEGLEAVVAELDRFLSSSAPRRDVGRPRLPVDRVFTIPGFGTVVTGTLSDGTLHVGQEVEIQPSGLKARIRGLQTHKEKIEEAVPGSRVAINLTGVSKDEIARGEVVTVPGWLRPTMLVDCHLRYLPDAPLPLKHNAAVNFFSGAAETQARVRLLGATAIPPGGTGLAQLRLERPSIAGRDDRLILRSYSPATTIGGARVLDPLPAKRRSRQAASRSTMRSWRRATSASTVGVRRWRHCSRVRRSARRQPPKSWRTRAAKLSTRASGDISRCWRTTTACCRYF